MAYALLCIASRGKRLKIKKKIVLYYTVMQKIRMCVHSHSNVVQLKKISTVKDTFASFEEQCSINICLRHYSNKLLQLSLILRI